MERAGACGNPKCRNFPSLAANPPQISRSDLAPPSWQNSMATNCPQLLNPRACRSALCLRAAVSNPVREMSCKICEKMLHTLFKAESSSDLLVFVNSTYQRLSAFFFPGGAQHCGANLDETEGWHHSRDAQTRVARHNILLKRGRSNRIKAGSRLGPDEMKHRARIPQI